MKGRTNIPTKKYSRMTIRLISIIVTILSMNFIIGMGPSGSLLQRNNLRQTQIYVPAVANLRGDYNLSNTANLSLLGGAEGDYFGTSVANAGDLNGDGYADILIGAYGYNPGGAPNTGRTYLFYGGSTASFLSGDYVVTASIANATFTGAAGGDEAGWSVTGAGDINQDGFDDLLIGAKGYGNHKGRVYLFYGNGSANTLRGDYNLTESANATFTGAAGGDYAGYAVAGAGDVNSDQFDDILIGATGYDGSGDNNGRVYLFYGNGSDNLLHGEYHLGTTDVVNATFTGTYYAGGFLGSALGCSVAGAGDVNGDGYADLLLGAENYTTTPWVVGRAYLVYGNGSKNLLSGDYDFANAANANATFTGGKDANDEGDLAACAVTGAGDVNGDGFDDFLIGAKLVGDSDEGGIYLFYGNEPENIFCGNYNLWVSANASFADMSLRRLGCSVTGAGDVNGDGYADVLVGAYRSVQDRGRAVLFYGNESGNLAYSNCVTFNGATQGDSAGGSVAGAGDVNGDGYADLLIGAPGNNFYDVTNGRAYLFYGSGIYPARIADLAVISTTPTSITLAWTAPGDDAWVGTASAYILKGSTWTINTSNWGYATIVAFPPLPAVSLLPQSYKVPGLSPNTTYCFGIKAVDDNGHEGLLSNIQQVTTLDDNSPEISSTGETIYVEGDLTPHNITWIINDPSTNSPTYTVRVNRGTPTAPVAWMTGIPIIFNTSGWLAGIYFVEITATDGYGQNTSDMAIVTVQARESAPDLYLVLTAVLLLVVVALGVAVTILWRKMQTDQKHHVGRDANLLPSNVPHKEENVQSMIPEKELITKLDNGLAVRDIPQFLQAVCSIVNGSKVAHDAMTGWACLLRLKEGTLLNAWVEVRNGKFYTGTGRLLVPPTNTIEFQAGAAAGILSGAVFITPHDNRFTVTGSAADLERLVGIIRLAISTPNNLSTPAQNAAGITEKAEKARSITPPRSSPAPKLLPRVEKTPVPYVESKPAVIGEFIPIPEVKSPPDEKITPKVEIRPAPEPILKTTEDLKPPIVKPATKIAKKGAKKVKKPSSSA